MRYLTLVILFAGLIGCVMTEESSMKDETDTAQSVEKSAIIADVEQAIAEKDYRLWASAGRQIKVPGIAPEHQEKAMKKCGYRFMPDVTDVIRNEQEKFERAAKYSYMQQYNQQMLKHCPQ